MEIFLGLFFHWLMGGDNRLAFVSISFFNTEILRRSHREHREGVVNGQWIMDNG